MSTNFPTSLDTYTTKVDGSDYPQAAHVNNMQDAIAALEAKVGIDGSAVSTSIDYLIKSTTGGHRHDGSTSRKVKATDLDVTGITANYLLRVNSGGTAIEGVNTTLPTGDLVGTTATQTLSNKTLTQPTLTLKQGASPTPTGEGDIQWDTDDNQIVVGDGASQKIFKDWTAMFDIIYPVGSIYTNATSSTNPGTLLGRGTWSAFGAGRVMVGYNASDTDFDTAEETGGAKTINIAHTHTTSAHTHTYSGTTSTYTADVPTGGSSGVNKGGTHSHTYTGTTASGGGDATGSSLDSAQSVMNPYIVVYLWKRTA